MKIISPFFSIFLAIVLLGCSGSNTSIPEEEDPIVITPILCDQSTCWNNDFYVCRYTYLNDLFTRTTGWTGGDATYSVKLPNGKQLWMFGDTFIDQVSENGTRPSFRLINNSLVLQDGDELTTYHGGTAVNPTSFVQPTEPNRWYWPGDATFANDTLYLFMQGFGNDTGGAWDFYRTSIDLLKMNPETLEIYINQRILKNPEITFGSAILEDSDYTYLYGVKGIGTDKFMHVVRTDASLNTNWEYYDGTAWTTDISKSVSLFHNVSEQFSVFKDNGTYYLLTQHHIFGNEIKLYKSNSPVGPWDTGKVIYCTPETGGNIFTYNAFAHPQIQQDSLVISYNINSFDYSDLLKDTNNYRPYFIKVGNWRD